MTTETWILATVFASLLVAFIVAIVGLLWKQSGIPKRVEGLEKTVAELVAESKLVSGLTEQVRGLSERVDREAIRNTAEHGALSKGIRAVTHHLLDIKATQKAAKT